MVVQDKLYTAADLLALPDDGRRYELIKGHLIEMTPAGETHGRITSRINYLLANFVYQHNLGQVYGAETGFKLAENPDTVYGVDAAFVSTARAQSREDYFDGAPDLAVEVVSPGNTKDELHRKRQDYFKAGARLVWVVYPKARTILVSTAVDPDNLNMLGVEDILTGGDVLPGFEVKVGEIFAVLDR